MLGLTIALYVPRIEYRNGADMIVTIPRSLTGRAYLQVDPLRLLDNRGILQV
jgi:hypothetical protein